MVCSREEGSDRFSIRFDDGDVCSVKERDVIICEMMAVDQEVLADRNNDGNETGVICGHYKHGDHMGYIVRFQDLEQKR